MLVVVPVVAFQTMRIKRARASKLSMNHRKTLSTVDIELPGGQAVAHEVGIELTEDSKPVPPRPTRSMTRAMSRAMSGIRPPTKEEGAKLVTSSASSESVTDGVHDLHVNQRKSLSTASVTASTSFSATEGDDR